MTVERYSRFVLASVFILGSALLYPNDQSVAVGAGGIVPKREVRVSMNKERLVISPDKITVEYEFENRTSRDVTTQIAFPIPEYSLPSEDLQPDFPDFKLWIDGEPAAFETDARAIVDGIDKTALLREMGITVETFGDWDYTNVEFKNDRAYFPDYKVNALSEEQKNRLIEAGLIEGADGPQKLQGEKLDFYYLVPRWSVRKAYYWTQRFPARQKVVIRHEYTPVVGVSRFTVDELPTEIRDSCITKGLIDRFRVNQKNHDNRNSGYYVGATWVRYILTTANSWKRPIREFELTVDGLFKDDLSSEYKIISFCWNGRSIVSENGRLTVREKNFVPKKDLVVYFYWE